MEEKLAPEEKISDWLINQAERRRSSNSSTDFDFGRRASMASGTFSIGEAEDKRKYKKNYLLKILVIIFKQFFYMLKEDQTNSLHTLFANPCKIVLKTP